MTRNVIKFMHNIQINDIISGCFVIVLQSLQLKLHSVSKWHYGFLFIKSADYFRNKANALSSLRFLDTALEINACVRYFYYYFPTAF